MHAVGMTISDIFAVSREGSEQQGILIHDDYMKQNGQFAIAFDSPVDTYTTLVLHFQYKLVHKDTGYHLTPYTARDGNQILLGATHMQARPSSASGAHAVYTREAFPCFDEPALKATFQLSVLTDPSVPVVLFNVPLARNTSIDPGTGLREWEFGSTPVMSSYIVAFALGNLTGISRTVPSSRSQHDISVTLWTTPDRIQNFDWALQSAAAILPNYEALFDYAYFLPKLDILALPGYLFQAMENWGLLVYEQTRIEIDPDESPHSVRYFMVADTIAHEMAHLWCGDLVTMSWWSDLWLNEACATNFEYFASDYASAAMQGVGTYFYPTAEVLPFRDDFAMNGEHPVSDPTYADAGSDAEVQSLFDDIEYQKGGSVLRMLWNYMSSSHYASSRLPADVQPRHDENEDSVTQADTLQDPFMECYAAWMQQKQYSSGTGADFLASFSNTSASPIDEWMHQWIYEAGYPLVIVEADANGTVFARQVDPLPIVQLGGEADAFIKVNVNQTGYYRVQYSDDLWHANARAAGANDSVFSQSDVAGLLDDAHTLHQMEGAINITVWLDLLQALGERGRFEYAPWSIAIAQLPAVSYYLQGLCGNALLSFIAKDVTGAFAGLPLNCSTMTGANDRAAASPILAIAAISPNPGLGAGAASLVMAAANAATSLDVDLANDIVTLAVASGEAGPFQQVLGEYKMAPDATKPVYSAILANSPNLDLLNATLYEALQQSEYSLANLQTLAAAFAGQRPQGRDLTWDFFVSNQDAILEKGSGDAGTSWGPFVQNVGSHYIDAAGQAKLDTVWKSIKGMMPSDQPYQAAKGSIANAITWVDLYGDDACSWLEARMAERSG
ncbi:g12742 [Coccomyxa viridis]|uniref:Aminopeptidase n=1 Tax=Coccomyxa viridis TaxID=1274662 RepID=A0ABP1GDP6_9CHLO